LKLSPLQVRFEIWMETKGNVWHEAAVEKHGHAAIITILNFKNSYVKKSYGPRSFVTFKEEN